MTQNCLAAPCLEIEHLGDVAEQVGEAFLLVHVVKLLGVVALAPVGDHHPGVVARNDLPHLLVAVLEADLIHRFLVVSKHIRKALNPAMRQLVSSSV